uniref:Macro domain-containing protein n=1 Tax=Poecilia reticulata TaxID=8081 RepID=A0A3P9NKF7_POERE
SGSMSKKKKDWKTEKERLLQLDREDRRKEYRKGFTQLDDIPTWREENRSRNKEDDEKELTGGVGLGDKVSLYKGDITVLEVDAIVNAGRSSKIPSLVLESLLSNQQACRWHVVHNNPAVVVVTPRSHAFAVVIEQRALG